MSELRRCDVCGILSLDKRFVCVDCRRYFCAECASRDGRVASTGVCAACIVTRKEPERCPRCGRGVPFARPIILDGSPATRRFCPICNEFI